MSDPLDDLLADGSGLNLHDILGAIRAAAPPWAHASPVHLDGCRHHRQPAPEQPAGARPQARQLDCSLCGRAGLPAQLVTVIQIFPHGAAQLCPSCHQAWLDAGMPELPREAIRNRQSRRRRERAPSPHGA